MQKVFVWATIIAAFLAMTAGPWTGHYVPAFVGLVWFGFVWLANVIMDITGYGGRK